ncbi:hypothetical protein [Curtobacterium sp. MCBD17_040]|uniref:hypothetical protein n=1 Tax=Curtobacterium sp. MCBD17_040 TaxID=2175674 RepID=UPI000DA9F0AA|nr:hypothetical protein [Curtobacterium sp. MCBD17_040]WIB65829.1 hypothetical protein DEI94_17090 [Curtobacterium sp. MCBD17_040]
MTRSNDATYLKWTESNGRISGQSIVVTEASGSTASTTSEVSANLTGTINGSNITLRTQGRNLTGTVSGSTLTLNSSRGTFTFRPGTVADLNRDRAALGGKVSRQRIANARAEAHAKQRAYEAAQQTMLRGLPTVVSNLTTWKQSLAAKNTAFTTAVAAVNHDMTVIDAASCWTEDQATNAETDLSTANDALGAYADAADEMNSPADALTQLLNGVGMTGLSTTDAAKVTAAKNLSSSVQASITATESAEKSAEAAAADRVSNIDPTKVCS